MPFPLRASCRPGYDVDVIPFHCRDGLMLRISESMAVALECACFRRLEIPPPRLYGTLLLPASAERPIKLHKTLVLCAARLRERQFGRKQRPLAVQHFEIRRGTSLVAHFGQTHGFLQVLNGILLANPHLMEFLIADQCIGYVAERSLNGLAVGN